MSEASNRKLFAAERALIERHATQRSAGGGGGSMDTREVIRAIEDLKSTIIATIQQKTAEDFPELTVLRGQLHELRDSIRRTKMEIAAVRHPEANDDRLLNAAMELDAIVGATEAATHNILSATEDIEERVQQLKDRVGDVTALHLLDEIGNLAIKIFENCNFQDITGQRTAKVVKTIHYLEERINMMITIWGEEEFRDIPMEGKKEGDEALLEGPQLANQGVSQADIDALFG